MGKLFYLNFPEKDMARRSQHSLATHLALEWNLGQSGTHPFLPGPSYLRDCCTARDLLKQFLSIRVRLCVPEHWYV